MVQGQPGGIQANELLIAEPDGALEWEFVLPHIQFVLNNSVNASTGQTPIEVCLYFRPRGHVDLRRRGPKDITAERSLRRKEAADSLATPGPRGPQLGSFNVPLNPPTGNGKSWRNSTM